MDLTLFTATVLAWQVALKNIKPKLGLLNASEE